MSAVARASDPQTSHDAAASVDELPHRRQAVLDVLYSAGPMTDEQLVEQYDALRLGFTSWAWLPRQSASGLRTRRCELVRLGLVVDTGERAELLSGRLGKVWRAA